MTYRLAIYAAAALAVVLGILGYGHVRYNAGERAAEARMQEQVDAANAKTARVEAQSRRITQEQASEIETLRQSRATEFAGARAAVQPVRLCKSGSGSQLPGTASAASAAHGATAGGTDVPLPAGEPDRAASALSEDIGPGLIALMESCQRDRDNFVGWQAWYREQAAGR